MLTSTTRSGGVRAIAAAVEAAPRGTVRRRPFGLPRSAAKVTSARDRNLDVLRGVSALGVVLWHATGPLSARSVTLTASWEVVLHTAAGVYLFFAISGYLIGGPWLRALVRGEPLPSWRPYAVRRVLRILPLYWLSLAAAIVILHPVDVNFGTIVLHAVLLQGFVPGQQAGIYFVLWTLAIEAQFYVSLPLVARLIRRCAGTRLRPRHAAIGLICMWLLSAPILLLDKGRLFDSDLTCVLVATLVGQAGAFAAGLAVVLIVEMRWLPQPPWIFLAVGCLVWLSASLVAPSTGPSPSPLWALAALPLILAAVRSPAWPLRPIAWCGLVSYSLYVCHTLVGAFVPHFSVPSPAAGLAVGFVTLLVPSVVVSGVLYACVERPSQRLGHALSANDRGPGG